MPLTATSTRSTKVGSIMQSTDRRPSGWKWTAETCLQVITQLKKERDRVEKQLSGLQAALTALLVCRGGNKPVRRRRKMSLAGRKRIAAAQRARWAKFRKSIRSSDPMAFH
jgi:hypothetical protein